MPGQHNRHDRAREGRIFGTDPRVNIWPFGLSTAAEGLLERLRSATARPGRLWYASAWLRAVLDVDHIVEVLRKCTGPDSAEEALLERRSHRKKRLSPPAAVT